MNIHIYTDHFEQMFFESFNQKNKDVNLEFYNYAIMQFCNYAI